MESIKQALNFTDSSGEIMTFFDGAITLPQVVGVALVAILCIALLNFVKKSFKLVVTMVCVVGAACYVGVVSPEQVKDVSAKIAQNGIETYEKIASASENIKIEKDSISIRVDNEWYNLSEVTRFVKTAGDKMSIFIDGNQHVVDDIDLIKLISDFS